MKADVQSQDEPKATLRVALVRPQVTRVSESFIDAHANYLPAQVTVVLGIPARIGTKSFPAGSLARRAVRKAKRIVTGGEWVSSETMSYVRAFKHIRPQVVLAEYGTIGDLVEPACRRLNLPLVVHFHGFDASRRDLLEQYRQRYARLFQTAAGIIAVSQAMKQRLIALGAPAAKVHYNPCGVDLTRFAHAQPEAAQPIFLSVGRFVEKKAPHLALLAFAEVYRQCPEARLRMIGDGPLLGVCQDLVKSLKLTSAVTFLGAQSHEQVQAEMQAARCFVQHSVIAASDGDSEGTPVAVLEAGASGLPVVATRHAGIPDVVVEQETGLLVDEHDTDGMARCMLQIAEDRQSAATLGQNARQRIAANFSMEHSIERLYNILASCAHSKGELSR